MKKILAFLFIFAVFFAFSSSAYAAEKKKQKKVVTRVEFETRDKFLLVGDLYFADQKKPARPLVVLLHSYGLRGMDFAPLARDLRAKNYNVLALDLRGHGRSVRLSNLKFKSRNSFTKDDWARFPYDAIEAVEFIKKNYPKINADEFYFIGADIGASSAVLAADKMKNKPVRMVLISPYLNFKGLDISSVIPKLNTVPMMIVASKSDKTSFAQADIVSRLVHSEVKTDYYDEGGSGVMLLKRNPLSYLTIVNYIISGK